MIDHACDPPRWYTDRKCEAGYPAMVVEAAHYCRYGAPYGRFWCRSSLEVLRQ